MSELDREALLLVELAREARTPSAADRARVRQRLATAGGVALPSDFRELAPRAAETAPAASAPTPRGARLVFGSAAAAWILGGVCAASAMVGGLVVVATLGSPSPASIKPTAPAPLTLPAPAPLTLPAPETEPETDTTTTAPRPSTRRATPPRDPLVAELELLHRARAAWHRAEPSRALALLDRHRARYAESAVAVERDALRVLCLCELGREREARPLGRRWLRAATDSPLRATVERSCAFE
jgi:RNA polymerase sigma-70 factor (ECF subfamily)